MLAPSGDESRQAALVDEAESGVPDNGEKGTHAMTATPYSTPAPTSTQVLSRAGQERALQLRGADDDSRWQVGDLSLTEIAAREGETVIVDGEPHVITKDEIRRAIGDLVGMESSTVRAREETAEYWPQADRAEFDDLPYSYFRTAMYAESRDAARAHLYRVLESADEYGGMIMPVRVLRMQVKAQRRATEGKEDDPKNDTSHSLVDTLRAIGTALEGILDTQDAPATVVLAVKMAKLSIDTALKWFGESVNG